MECLTYIGKGAVGIELGIFSLFRSHTRRGSEPALRRNGELCKRASLLYLIDVLYVQLVVHLPKTTLEPFFHLVALIARKESPQISLVLRMRSISRREGVYMGPGDAMIGPADVVSVYQSAKLSI